MVVFNNLVDEASFDIVFVVILVVIFGKILVEKNFDVELIVVIVDVVSMPFVIGLVVVERYSVDVLVVIIFIVVSFILDVSDRDVVVVIKVISVRILLVDEI